MTYNFKDALTKAVTDAINEIGIEELKKTSMFMSNRVPPFDNGLGEPIHNFEDTFSAETVVLEKFFRQ